MPSLDAGNAELIRHSRPLRKIDPVCISRYGEGAVDEINPYVDPLRGPWHLLWMKGTAPEASGRLRVCRR